MKKISAIIISYGQVYELKRALKCLENQECNVDEIIVVDNSTLDISQLFLDKGMNLRYITVKEKYSKLQLCQIGIREAAGDYIAFLDCYDIWNLNKVKAVKEQLVQKPEIDIIAHSYFQQVCTHQENYSTLVYKQKDSGELGILQFLHAPSSVVMSRKLAVCLEVIDLKAIKSMFIPEVYSEHWSGACRDTIEMEKKFWSTCKDEILKLNLLEKAISYSHSRFHASEDEQTMYQNMIANNIIPVEYISLFFNIQNIRISQLMQQKDWLIEKQHKNYILMRNWLEIKISGKKVAEKLIEMGINTIAIYGAGKHGTMLFDEISKDVIVKCWIDRNIQEKNYKNIPVMKSKDISIWNNEIDAIIITPYIEYDTICSELKRETSVRLISLWDLMKG